MYAASCKETGGKVGKGLTWEGGNGPQHGEFDHEEGKFWWVGTNEILVLRQLKGGGKRKQGGFGTQCKDIGPSCCSRQSDDGALLEEGDPRQGHSVEGRRLTRNIRAGCSRAAKRNHLSKRNQEITKRDQGGRGPFGKHNVSNGGPNQTTGETKKGKGGGSRIPGKEATVPQLSRKGNAESGRFRKGENMSPGDFKYRGQFRFRGEAPKAK